MSRFCDERFDGITTAISVVTQSGFVGFGAGAGGFVGTDANRIRGSGSTSVAGSVAWARTAPASADYEVGADFFVAAGGFVGGVDPPLGICGRCDTAADNFYFIRAHGSTGWTLYRFMAGVGTVLGSSVAQTWTASTTYAVRLVMIGSQISVWVNGTKIIDYADGTPITAAGLPGMRNVGGFLGSVTQGMHLDNFYADDYVNRTSFHGYSAVPADNGSHIELAFYVPPVAGMVAGQLAVILCAHRAVDATFTIYDPAGQTWNRIAFGGISSFDLHWCRFNGTWSIPNGPFIGVDGGTNAVPVSAVMLVFNPGMTGTVEWAEEVSGPLVSMATSPFTLTGYDTFFDKTLSLAVWISQDDNTWNLSDEFGWQNPGCLQWRNTAGNDMSIHAEFCALTAPGTLTNPGTTQQTLGPDVPTGTIITFAEMAGIGGGFKAAWARGANALVGAGVAA